MLSTKPSSDPQQQQQQQFLQITRHDKFYCRLLSKETSLTNPSFRVYYGGASGAVPFLWESQPGTPKNTIPTSTLPPLTPPPSYHSTPKKQKKTKKFSAIHSILPKLVTTKRSNLLSMSSPSTSPPVSISSSSVSSSRSSGSHRRSRLSSPRSSFSSKADEEDLIDRGSPTSTLFFGVLHRGIGGMKGCYSMVNMKNALSWIVSGGHGQGSSTSTAA